MPAAERVADRFSAKKTPRILEVVLDPLFHGVLKRDLLKSVEEYLTHVADDLLYDTPEVTEEELAQRMVGVVYERFDPFYEDEGLEDRLATLFVKGPGKEITYTAGIPTDDPMAIRVELADGKFYIRFEVWGEQADMSNRDERANADPAVDRAISQKFGFALYDLSFVKGAFDEYYFVYKYTYDGKYSFPEMLRAKLGPEVEKLALEKAREKKLKASR